MKVRALLLALTLASAAAAIEPVVFEDPALEARYRDLLSELRCLVCQNQTLADSNAPLAMDLRAEVRKMLEQGASDREIVEFLTDRYGNFVLYRPPFDATTAALWIAPALFLLIGGFVGWRVLRGGRSAVPADDEGDRSRIRELLERGDEP